MSLNFSDDDDNYESKVSEEQEKKEQWGEENYENEKFEENENVNENVNENDFDVEATEQVEEKKKRKKSLGVHLKNIFNDTALNRIHRYIKKKRKRECLKHGEEFFDEDDSASEKEEDDDDDVEDIEKYVKKEQKRLAQMVPEKDEFWELYIYLNLKKKKRKIEYDPTYYSNAFRKILENVQKDYIKIIEEHLFKNEKLKEYFITDDIDDVLKKLPNNIFQIENFLKARVIKKCYTLKEINRKLTDLFNKGNFCNYIKETNIYNTIKDSENSNENRYENGVYDEKDANKKREKEKEIEMEKKENEFHRSLSTSVSLEREKLNMTLKKIYEKYVDLINKVKRHQRSELRTSFNLFMNLINEATSKLYFNVHNVMVTEENSKITDIYKTIRRKYNMHDVLNKIQKLTNKKEVYEVYRSYLLYKYKSTQDICNDAFKNHIMQDNVNIFNFKKFYNTDFAIDMESIIKTVTEKKDSEEEEEEEEVEEETFKTRKEGESEKGVKGVFNKQRKYPVDESYKNDIYTDDFFKINGEQGGDENSIKTNLNKLESKDAYEHTSNYKKKEKTENFPVTQPAVKEHVVIGKTEKKEEPEETPLEKAKRIAREKKKKLLESRTRII